MPTIAKSPKNNGKAQLPPPSAKWPAAHVEMWDLKKLKAYPQNPRTHSKEQIAQLVASFREFGWTVPMLVDEQGEIIAGHGREAMAAAVGLKQVPVIVARGWTLAQKRAYRIADNKLTLASEWDQELLIAEFKALHSSGYELGLTGFVPLEFEEMGLDFESTGEEEEDVRATLLKLVDVTIQEPRHEVEKGDRYILAKRHHLLCASVITDWPEWAPLLKEGCLFVPYAGVFVPFGTKAKSHKLIMIQPDPYIAGHMLDRFQEVHGEKAIARIK